jgi:hypothetical protein
MDRFSASSFPVASSTTMSKLTIYPSFRSRNPARATAPMRTNTLNPPSTGLITPQPFEALNHWTVPVVITRSLRVKAASRQLTSLIRGRASRARRRWRLWIESKP